MQIEVKNAGKNIKNSVILEGINLSLQSGKIYGFIGQNGCGKTMLLRMLIGLIVPSSGSIEVDGRVLHKDISFPPNVGLLVEKPEFLPYMNGFDNLRLLAEVKQQIDKEEIKKWMSFFDLDPNSKKWVCKYSQGMKQKLGIIQAVMENPDLLVLDESFNALDEKSVIKLRNLLLDLKQQGKLVVITSHNKEDIDFLCDEIYKMSDGHIVE